MKSKTARKRSYRGQFYGPMMVIVIVILFVFFMSMLFRVSTIEVQGNRRYTRNQIITASGIEVGDNLFFINRIHAATKVFSDLPYVDEVVIERDVPNKITIKVVESNAIAYLKGELGYWALDSSSRLLSSIEKSDSANLILVTGITAAEPSVGDTLVSTEAGKGEYLKEILGQLNALGILKNVTSIDMTNVNCPVFDYEGRFVVKLGPANNVPYKFKVLISAVNQLSEGDNGVLDLSIDDSVHFSYN